MNKKCLGCGIELQNENENKIGYTSLMSNDLCNRCFKLIHYGEYEDVSLSNNDFQKIIDNISDNSLILCVSSLLNLNLSLLNKKKDNILVLTKRDLLPKSVKDEKIIAKIKKQIGYDIDIVIVCSLNNYNLDNLITKIKNHKKDIIYFVGKTNSGKSTLINKIIKNYTSNDNFVTTSMYPSTTLSKIEIKLDDFGTIIDTPGLISNGSIISNIKAKDIKRLIPKKEIKPKSYQLKKRGSLLIDNLIRLDYYKSINVTFYFANNINILNISENNHKLKDKYKYSFDINEMEDIVIEDFGFIKFKEKCKIDVYSLYNLNIYKRDNLI